MAERTQYLIVSDMYQLNARIAADVSDAVHAVVECENADRRVVMYEIEPRCDLDGAPTGLVSLDQIYPLWQDAAPNGPKEK